MWPSVVRIAQSSGSGEWYNLSNIVHISSFSSVADGVPSDSDVCPLLALEWAPREGCRLSFRSLCVQNKLPANQAANALL